MVFSMCSRLRFWRVRCARCLNLLCADQFTTTTFALNLGFGRGTESMRTHGQFFGQLAISQDFDAAAAIGQTRFAHRVSVHTRAILKSIQRLQVYRKVTSGKTRVIKAAFGNPPDERHLSTFKADADRTAGTGGLTFAAPTTGLAVATGFALTKTFAPMLGTRTRF